MLETQLNLEYVENLHLTTVLSRGGTVVRWNLVLLKLASKNTKMHFKFPADILIYTNICAVSSI